MTRADLVLDLKRLLGGGTIAAVAAWLGKYGPAWWQARQISRQRTGDIANELAGTDDATVIKGVLRREFVSAEQVSVLIERVTTQRLQWFSQEFERMASRIRELEAQVADLQQKNQSLQDELVHVRGGAGA